MSKQRKHDQHPDSDASEAWRDVERALLQILPGLEIFDRDLELSADARADLVGIDEQGRLTLVLSAGGEGEAPILRALDALAFARRNSAPLARHLGAQGLRSELDPRVILVAEAFSRKLVERLVPLAGRGVDLYELRVVTSAAGRTRWLAPACPLETASEATVPVSEETFLGVVPAELRELGRSLLTKMKRLDSELECRPGRSAIHWSFRAQPLARLELSDGRLYSSTAPRFESRSLVEPADMERALEEVLERYVALLELNGSSAPDSSSAPQPAAAGVLLSHEELEAFRQ